VTGRKLPVGTVVSLENHYGTMIGALREEITENPDVYRTVLVEIGGRVTRTEARVRRYKTPPPPSQTPFDLGRRLRPVPWVRTTNDGAWWAGSDTTRRAEPDDFGRVDFDDDADTSIVTIHVEQKGEGFEVVIQHNQDAVPVTIREVNE
jgi:hypothetical protein